MAVSIYEDVPGPCIHIYDCHHGNPHKTHLKHMHTNARWPTGKHRHTKIEKPTLRHTHTYTDTPI